MANIIGQKVDVKVYIEGHLIPSQRVSITLYDGQTSVMNIETTPDNSVKKISPMSLVSVFYYDNNIRDWCLFWEGFYTGWQFSRAASGRSISLTAMDWTGLFNKISALMLGNPEELINGKMTMYGMGNSQPHEFIKGAKTNIGNNELITKIAKLAYSYFKPRDMMSFESVAENVIKQETNANTFSQIAMTLIESLMWLNPQLYFRFDKSKMIKKFTSIKDDNLWSFYEADLLERAIKDIGASYFNGETSLANLITAWEAQMFYSRSTMCAPPFATERTTVNGTTTNESAFYQHIWHPKSFFGIPPACNVIFPEFITNISYSRNYMQDATRLIMKTSPIGLDSTGIYTGFFYSERNEEINSKQMYEGMDGLPQNMYSSQLSAEEYERYITPSTHTLNNSLYHVLSKTAPSKGDKGEKSFDAIRKMMGAVSHYMFLEKKYGNRPLTISGCFNPYFIPGYPCLVFDDNFQFMAKPISVTHSISASGNATTQYMCNFTIDLDKDDIFSSSKFPPLPGWLPKAYMPENINSTYESIFGKNGLGFSALQGFGAEGSNTDIRNSVNPEISETINKRKSTSDNYGETGIGTSKENIAVLANSLFSLDRDNPSGAYDNAKDKIEFARKYVMRSVTTMNQYKQFYGLSTDKEPQMSFGKSDVFKHIINIKEGTQNTLMFIDADNQKDKKPNMDSFVKDLERSGSAQAIYDYHKYDRMSDIQKILQKKGFKG